VALDVAASPSSAPVFYQEFIDGLSLAAIFCAHGARARLLGITRQLHGKPSAPFAYVGSIGPWPVSSGVRARVAEVGEVLAASFCLAGLFGVDLILRGEVPWPVEVNPRYTASVEVLELALRRSFLSEHRSVFEASAPNSLDDGGGQIIVGKA